MKSADDRDHLPGVDRQIETAQNRQQTAGDTIRLRELGDLEEGHGEVTGLVLGVGGSVQTHR